LGVLDPAECAAFEAHLAGCDACADEIEALLPVTGMLAGLDAAEVVAAHNIGAPRQRRPMAGVAALHRRVAAAPRHHLPALPAGGRGRVLAAAGVVVGLVAVASFFAGSQLGGGGPAVAVPEPYASASAGPHSLAGATRRIEATDASSGVHAILSVAPAEWGSQVQLTIGGLRGPLLCDLVAIGTDGQSTVVASWSVYEPGYGIPEDPDLLTIESATAVTLADTRRFEVRELPANGIPARLVTLLV
jgi:hypothetical protein